MLLSYRIMLVQDCSRDTKFLATEASSKAILALDSGHTVEEPVILKFFQRFFVIFQRQLAMGRNGAPLFEIYLTKSVFYRLQRDNLHRQYLLSRLLTRPHLLGTDGVTKEDQKKSQELRLQVNGGINMDRSTKELMQTNEISACGSQMEGCCHIYGMTLSTCCQGPLLSEIADNDNLNEEAKFDTATRCCFIYLWLSTS